jgi:hypothetical protein
MKLLTVTKTLSFMKKKGEDEKIGGKTNLKNNQSLRKIRSSSLINVGANLGEYVIISSSISKI